MFKVYQDDQLADTSGYPTMHESWSPSTNTHNTFEKAVKYAHLWAYPYTIDMLNSLSMQKMELNTPINMSMGECPVMMEIREA